MSKVIIFTLSKYKYMMIKLFRIWFIPEESIQKQRDAAHVTVAFHMARRRGSREHNGRPRFDLGVDYRGVALRQHPHPYSPSDGA